MLRCSRPYRFQRMPRKKLKRTEVKRPELDRPSQVRRITMHPSPHRTARARFRHRLRSHRIPLLRPNLCRLCQVRPQLPILRAPPERRLPRGHRLPPKSPPYRRLESLTCDNPLPRDLRLPWISRRAGKAVLPPRRSQCFGAHV